MGWDNHLGRTEDNPQCQVVVFTFHPVCRMNYLEGFCTSEILDGIRLQEYLFSNMAKIV